MRVVFAAYCRARLLDKFFPLRVSASPCLRFYRLLSRAAFLRGSSSRGFPMLDVHDRLAAARGLTVGFMLGEVGAVGFQ